MPFLLVPNHTSSNLLSLSAIDENQDQSVDKDVEGQLTKDMNENNESVDSREMAGQDGKKGRDDEAWFDDLMDMGDVI